MVYRSDAQSHSLNRLLTLRGICAYESHEEDTTSRCAALREHGCRADDICGISRRPQCAAERLDRSRVQVESELSNDLTADRIRRASALAAIRPQETPASNVL